MFLFLIVFVVPPQMGRTARSFCFLFVCGQAKQQQALRKALQSHQPIIIKIIRILEMQVQHEQDPGQGAPQEETGVHVLTMVQSYGSGKPVFSR